MTSGDNNLDLSEAETPVSALPVRKKSKKAKKAKKAKKKVEKAKEEVIVYEGKIIQDVESVNTMRSDLASHFKASDDPQEKML